MAALLALATAAIRLPRALGDAFWQDEIASARVIREPSFIGMLHHDVRTESTPPLWYAVGWLLHKAGVSLHDVRLLSVAADALIVALVVRLAATLAPLPVAAAGGVVCALGAQLTAHGHELRAYELFALLGVVFASALRAAALAPSRRGAAALAAVTAAGVLTHYFFLFTLAAGVVWTWLEPAARAARRRVTVAIAAGLAACSPWLPMFLAQYRHDRYSWIGPFDPRLVLETPLREFSPPAADAATALLFLAWLAVGVLVAGRCGPPGRLIAALALGPIVIAAVAWASGPDIFAVRNLISTAPFSAVVVVLPLAKLPRRLQVRAAAVVAVAAVASFLVGQKPTPPFQRIAAALVRIGWAPGQAVVVDGNFLDYRSPLEWYLPHVPVLVRGRLDRLSGSSAFAVAPKASMPHDAAGPEVRVGSLVVARLPREDVTRWLSRAAVLEPRPRGPGT